LDAQSAASKINAQALSPFKIPPNIFYPNATLFALSDLFITKIELKIHNQKGNFTAISPLIKIDAFEFSIQTVCSTIGEA
jgi:hypothetical protein